jgi:hypothetical protein
MSLFYVTELYVDIWEQNTWLEDLGSIDGMQLKNYVK